MVPLSVCGGKGEGLATSGVLYPSLRVLCALISATCKLEDRVLPVLPPLHLPARTCTSSERIVLHVMAVQVHVHWVYNPALCITTHMLMPANQTRTHMNGTKQTQPSTAN